MRRSAVTTPIVGLTLALAAPSAPLSAVPPTESPSPRPGAPPCGPRAGAMMRDFGFAPLPRVVRPAPGTGKIAIHLGTTPTIARVDAGGPAGGRLQNGDVVLAIDGLPTDTEAAAARYLRVRPGEQVRFTVRRGDERHDVTITTGETCVPIPAAPPAPGEAPGGTPTPDAPLPPAGAELLDPRRFGFAIRCDQCGDETQAGRTSFRFGVPPTVAFVDPDSPAGRAGLRAGDRLTHVNGIVLTGGDGWPALQALGPGASAELTFARGDASFRARLTAR